MASGIDTALPVLLIEDWLYYFPLKLISCSFFIILKGPPVESMNVMAMEKLPINNNGGQGYGFILYETTLKRLPKQITIQHVYDRAQVLSTHALQGSIWDLSFGGEVLPSATSLLGGPRKLFEKNMRWDAIWCILRHNFQKCYSGISFNFSVAITFWQCYNTPCSSSYSVLRQGILTTSCALTTSRLDDFSDIVTYIL